MRKSLLTLGLASLALSSFGATRILYQQNFETATSVEETGWSFGGESIAIASDAFGKFLELSLGQNNGRSGQVTWGQEIFLDEQGNTLLEDGKYTVEYDFCIAKGSNNQYNGEFTVFTNHAPIANNTYRMPWSDTGHPAHERGVWDNYLFDMSQVNGESLQFVIDGPTIVNETTGEDGNVTKTYEIDYSDPNTLDEGAWYTVTLEVNVDDRTVEYSVVSLDGNIVKAGTRTVPETDLNGDPVSMYAEGIFTLLARYQTIVDFDNIKVWYDSQKDHANPPTIALTRLGKTADDELDMKLRAYTITFIPGETLHVTGTDGQTYEAEYDDCEGNYVYETSNSGVLKAWTTCGTATSKVIETTVDCTPVVLPEAKATISAVEAGYGKTYTITVNNTEVPLRPTIFINYEYTSVNGEKLSAEGLASGCTLTVTEAGTLKITTESFGYEATTISVENDLQFETKKTWDFARMTEEEISTALTGAAWNTLNSASTSGFNNWTARKRLYYNLEGSMAVDDEGNESWTAVYPFGFIAEDNTVNVIKYAVVDRAAIAETTKGQYFDGLTIFPERGKVDAGGLPNVGMLYRIGLYNDQTKNNNNNVYIHDLNASDFVVVNYINNYGGNSCHPVCATDDEYFAQLAGENTVLSAAAGTHNEETNLYDVVYALYRIDTAISKITVFSQVGGDAVEAINAVEGDGYWYTIEGVRVAEPTQPGLYIHNGKKYIVK
ncbi:MAG: hypothetical protein K2H38_10700 [Muribaculaceae bacterium]|nr:hypothetical protein [Muribaculaceae bacterium]